MVSTREEKIELFIQQVRFWLSEQAQVIADIEDNGAEGSEEWNQIMEYIEEAIWVIHTLYDGKFSIIDDDSNAVYNFMWNWTDEYIDSFMSDWKARWGVGQTAAVSTVLTKINILGGTGGSGIAIPAGGTIGDHLILTPSGLGWETPETIHDLGEQI